MRIFVHIQLDVWRLGAVAPVDAAVALILLF
jgi:hypothetical protein